MVPKYGDVYLLRNNGRPQLIWDYLSESDSVVSSTMFEVNSAWTDAGGLFAVSQDDGRFLEPYDSVNYVLPGILRVQFPRNFLDLKIGQISATQMKSFENYLRDALRPD